MNWLKMECAIDALYLIGNELRHCDSDCMEEAGNALYLLQEIMQECLAGKRREKDADEYRSCCCDLGPHRDSHSCSTLDLVHDQRRPLRQDEAGRHTAVSMDTGPSWLEKIRLERGISQKAVADAAGISQPTYCNIEKGKRGVSVETAKRIAAELGFEWTRFFEENSESA